MDNIHNNIKEIREDITQLKISTAVLSTGFSEFKASTSEKMDSINKGVTDINKALVSQLADSNKWHQNIVVKFVGAIVILALGIAGIKGASSFVSPDDVQAKTVEQGK